ncbi:MAG: hypothetical protein IJJ52_02820 [Lachnospiraceae bacterium]|nr:hypothetical protein [Lachnospiraceae bacterium]
MMIVTVDVPMMGDRYEFQFDENTYVAVLIEEFIDMICRKNGCAFSGDINRMLLWNADSRCLLRRDRTAAANGIENGQTLILA